MLLLRMGLLLRVCAGMRAGLRTSPRTARVVLSAKRDVAVDVGSQRMIKAVWNSPHVCVCMCRCVRVCVCVCVRVWCVWCV